MALFPPILPSLIQYEPNYWVIPSSNAHDPTFVRDCSFFFFAAEIAH